MHYTGGYITHPDYNDGSIFKVLYKEDNFYICVRYCASHNVFNTCTITESDILKCEYVDDFDNIFTIENEDYLNFLRGQ